MINANVVPPDAIYDWSRREMGKVGGQSKIPHIDPTPEGEMIRSLATFVSSHFHKDRV